MASQVLGQSAIPAQLSPWREWVVRDILDLSCPSSSLNFKKRECVWAGQLEVSINQNSGQFEGTWRTFSRGYIDLPGQKGQWPLDVKVNGRTAIVVEHNGLPSIELGAGNYKVTGRFAWAKPPLRLVLPPNVGLVRLNAYGKSIPNPNFDSRGDLWLKGNQAEVTQKKNFLQIKLFRKLTDDIPAIDQTLIELSVGGSEREVELSSTLLKGFIPLSFTASIPAKWESSGKLKLRVRPGKHTVNLRSRSVRALTSLKIPKHTAPLPQKEVWSFVARNQLRVVQIQGVDQVDSQQIAMPQVFRGHPTYLMLSGSEFKVQEVSRGIKGDKENELTLRRTHWLDFSGKRFTVKDQITGRMKKEWRLSMVSPFELGSVRTGNKNQLVTIDDGAESTGVEVRNAQLNLTAESRLDKKGVKIPATGWNENFKNIQGVFNIPPGWKTLALFGADFSTGTWFSKWSLLSLFFVLVLSIGMFKLKGLKWSLVTFFSLVLLIHEKNAPYWIWLHLLIALGLERAMAQREKINNFVRFYRLICLLILVVISFPFVVEQIQKAIYPSLERQSSNRSFYSSIGSSKSSRSYAPRKVMKRKAKELVGAVKSKGFQADQSSFGGAAIEEDLALSESRVQVREKMEFDPNSQIQTGPGIPTWSWGRVSYGWEGPVKKGQSIYLITLSPMMNRLFTFLRILFLGLLLYCFIDLGSLRKSGLLAKASKGLIGLFLVGSLYIGGSNEAFAETFPDKELLKDLKTEVLKPASCYPNCISIEKMSLKYTPDKLMIKLVAHVASDSYFTLPGSRDQWFPRSVIVDGKKASSLKGMGQGLSLYLDKGIHDIVLFNNMGPGSQVQVALGLKPKNIEHSGSGWSVEGIRENGTIESSLTLYRKEKKKKGSVELGSTLLPHFVKIERVFNMGLNWSVRTTVTRLSPIGRAINLEVQKVQGERLTSSNIEDQGDFFKVNLSKSSRSISWNSLLSEVDKFSLKASSNKMISEVWRFQPGPIWRVQFEGLAKIAQVNKGSELAPFYRPWPEESIMVKVSRPKAAPGKAITLEQANLNITPGKRLTSYDLQMTFKTSMGVAHSIKLPAESKLRSVKINGKLQSLNLKEGTLRLPLGVGAQKVQVMWEANEGVQSLFRTPLLDLGLKGINLKLQVRLSAKRWVIYLGGPVMGPAVLFWGKLIALFILSFFLSKISWCPLNFFHWSLLSIGLTQGFNGGIFIVISYIVFLSFRRQHFLKMGKAAYNSTSFLAILGAVISISTFFLILKNGLLGGPLMDIEGNESSAFILNWFVDRFDGTIPYAWVFSFPTITYQLLMLIWAIWMTFSLIKWVPWLWEGLYGNGFFRKIEINMKNESSRKKASKENDEND
jgi:hypothetical protein